MIKRLIHIITFVFGGLWVWLVMGVPFKDAFESMIKAEQIVWEEDQKSQK